MSGSDDITGKLLKVIKPELGYKERAGQHTKFGAWYSKAVDDPQYKNAPWCDMFIAWAANRAGVAEFVGEFAWTPSHARWFEQRGAWTSEPEVGALVFFDWSGSKNIKKIDHVGIVERVAGGKIHTIEANVDRVWLKRKVRDESKVVGYGVPRKVKEFVEAEALRVQAGHTAPEPVPPQAVSAAGMSGREAVPVEFVPTTGLIALGVMVGTIVLVARRTVARPQPATAGRHRRRRRAQPPPAGRVSAAPAERVPAASAEHVPAAPAEHVPAPRVPARAGERVPQPSGERVPAPSGERVSQRAGERVSRPAGERVPQPAAVRSPAPGGGEGAERVEYYLPIPAPGGRGPGR
ncbi:hypothetical protein HNP84_007862 [Thermocatellispora tengchongensis]|uniref:Peptidase C51 domain-containing protein n=1 Tax=Thermocatellispora tengchongensis TaxID=1073253 RepID=A0A840PGK3_9ACTN|nr:CHAP domain-containing protein [Thermocatellispora tengchongensis]MBB5138109.1 hypothetical protein [Thermocatellispora tengchongensis]